MTYLTFLTIANNLDNLLIEPKENKTTKKWTAFLYLKKNNHPHSLLLSFADSSFESKEEAVDTMQKYVDWIEKESKNKKI